jgi:putative methyltransferase
MCRDARLSDVLVLPRGTDLHGHALITRGLALMQDWASCLPAHVLSAHGTRRFRVVIDACAAPGNKATHMQALALQEAGLLVAVERDQHRAQALSDTAHRLGAHRIVVVNQDWLSLDPLVEPQRSAEAILVDPSCSGSQTQGAVPPQRLEMLAAFQTKALLRALSYAHVRVVVYSTCSVDRRENEDVVAAALQAFGHVFALEECLPWWPHRGLRHAFVGAEKCVRTDAWRDKTQGFFVASFVRTAGSRGAREHQAAHP